MFYRLFILFRDAVRQMPLLHFYVWKLRKAFWRLQSLGEARLPIVDGGPLLAEAIRANRPFAAGKMGFTESLGLNHYLKRTAALSQNREPPPYPPYASETLFINSGVFPREDKLFDRFAAIYRDTVKDMDLLVSWEIRGELKLFNLFAPLATLIWWGTIEPFLSNEPWSSTLEGKRVLVISPFAKSIQGQYARRTKLWRDQRILPAFALLTIRCPFSAGLVAPKHSDWMEALDDLKGQMDAIDFDVALIGAGAFSLPLATHAKRRGKVGIHIGGPLQVLFGIYGNRWKDLKEFQAFINESWVRPGKDETPEKVHKNENACYW